MFTIEQKEQIRAWARQHPRQLQHLRRRIQEEWEIAVSIDTIKRVLKSIRLNGTPFIVAARLNIARK